MQRLKWGLAAVFLGAATLLLWIAVGSAREQSGRSQSRQNLAQIGLALHQYHLRWNSFPPAYVAGPDGKPWHSWRVLLLPHLGEDALYAQYHFDEPWDGPRNRELQRRRPQVFTSPLQQSRDDSVTTYLGVQSRRTMWPAYFPVREADVSDGSSNTLHLLEDVRSQTVWTAPEDLTERVAVELLESDADRQTARDVKNGFHILMVDGSVRFINRSVEREFFVSLLTPKFRQSTVADADWPTDLLAGGPLSSATLPTPVDPATLPNTTVVPSTDAALNPSRSTVYCATFQLAWDQLRPAAGTPVPVATPTALTDSLNAMPFPLSDLAPETYFLSSAQLNSAAEAEMWEAFRAKFPQAPAERPPVDPGLPGRLLFAYLQKSMPFRMSLERLPAPLAFQSQGAGGIQSVASFGQASKASDKEDAFPEILAVCDYVNDDDFILKLMTESRQRDEIFIAKVSPDQTLRAAWLSISDRLSRPRNAKTFPRVRGMDTVQIPILSFGLVAHFDELVGLTLEGNDFIADARQAIQFRLDENGAELISDAYLIVGEMGDDADNTLKPRRFVCDRPFLIALRERDAVVPYLLAWIGNADLMVPMKTE